jgi:hypothetical protein
MTRLKTIRQESTVENQIVIKSSDGTFRAYISRPAKLPAPVVVVLQGLFGVNADIRVCDPVLKYGDNLRHARDAFRLPKLRR